MTRLSENPCQPEDGFCDFVRDTTHSNWLASAADWLIAKPLSILVLLLIALVVRWLAFRVIDRLSVRAASGMIPDRLVQGKLGRSLDQTPARAAAVARRTQRAHTMASVLKSITAFVIFTIVGVTVFAELGYPIGPLVTGAGVIGLSIGFGAQSLVKDFLSGVFMVFEDQYGVGDTVTLSDITGTVEAVTLRVTRLRTEDGIVWYVRNGEILKVGNRSQS